MLTLIEVARMVRPRMAAPARGRRIQAAPSRDQFSHGSVPPSAFFRCSLSFWLIDTCAGLSGRFSEDPSRAGDGCLSAFPEKHP